MKYGDIVRARAFAHEAEAILREKAGIQQETACCVSRIMGQVLRALDGNSGMTEVRVQDEYLELSNELLLEYGFKLIPSSTLVGHYCLKEI